MEMLSVLVHCVYFIVGVVPEGSEKLSSQLTPRETRARTRLCMVTLHQKCSVVIFYIKLACQTQWSLISTEADDALSR